MKNQAARNTFRKRCKLNGIENAYRRLKAYTKFKNYADNTVAWSNDSMIKYSSECNEDLTMDLAGSCEIANSMIVEVMGNQ